MTTFTQRSFASGELSPQLYARVDTVKYATGLRTLRNFIVNRHGGVSSRPGTTFVAEVKDSTKKVRLIKFQFNAEQTYILEFGNQYMRVHRYGTQLSDITLTITNVTKNNPGVMTYTGTDPQNGDEIYVKDIEGMTELNGRSFKIANVNSSANTFELQDMTGTNFNTSSLSTYTSGGTALVVYEIATPYLESDLDEIQYVQSADVVTLVHPSYEPRHLSRSGHTNWSLSTINFTPTISTPTGLTSNYASGSTYEWVVTAVSSTNFEESLVSNTTQSSTNPENTPVTLSWNAVSDAQEYNVYRKVNGIFGLIGVAGSNTFVDEGATPNTTDTPPIARNPFSSSNNYPSCVAYIQQRLVFANTNNNPENIYMSQTGRFNNFTISSPLQNDDAVTFNLVGKQVNAVRHLVDLGKLIVFTSGGEWEITGGVNGIIQPGEINPKQYTYTGSSTINPIIVEGTALFLQARKSIIRDLAFDFAVDGYRGNDLTIFSSHLVEGYQIENWDYQQTPQSIVWMCRNDGVLLGLTYVRDQQILGWHRHDFTGDAKVENVCTIPENNDEYLYLVVKREINGKTVRYIERMSQRFFTDVKDYIGMDSTLSYDGRNTDSSHTMTISNGTNYIYTETLTLTSSTSFFNANDVGNQIELKQYNATTKTTEIIRFKIKNYVNSTVVTGSPNRTVNASMRNVAISDWAKQVDELGGLWHIEGEKVSVLADSFVKSNPNNPTYLEQTVQNGKITLDAPHSVIHVGLPYNCDLQTLNIDVIDGETFGDKLINIDKVTIFVENSRGGFISSTEPEDESIANMAEFKMRENENYDDAIKQKSEQLKEHIDSTFNKHERVFLRQTDPLPLSILSIMPHGITTKGG